MFLEPLIHSATVQDTGNTAMNKIVKSIWRTQFNCELSHVLIYSSKEEKGILKMVMRTVVGGRREYRIVTSFFLSFYNIVVLYTILHGVRKR